MIYGIKRVLLYLLGTDIAGRNLRVYPDDTFIVSYPRSGNTWTRFLVANLIHPDEHATFANIERIIPDAEAHSSRYLLRIARPRVIKSHEYFDHRYRKVIYIVRDPRDVAVSYYNFQRKYRQITDDYSIAQYVRDFVAGRLGSADWGTWAENVGSWLIRDGHPGFLLLRYEDLEADTMRELAKISVFFNIDPAPQLLSTVAGRSSAVRMRELERTQASQWVATKGRRQDIPFVGTASSGGWTDRLPPESVAEIESAWGRLMLRLGYKLVTRAKESVDETAVDGNLEVHGHRQDLSPS